MLPSSNRCLFPSLFPLLCPPASCNVSTYVFKRKKKKYRYSWKSSVHSRTDELDWKEASVVEICNGGKDPAIFEIVNWPDYRADGEIRNRRFVPPSTYNTCRGNRFKYRYRCTWYFTQTRVFILQLAGPDLCIWIPSLRGPSAYSIYPVTRVQRSRILLPYSYRKISLRSLSPRFLLV